VRRRRGGRRRLRSEAGLGVSRRRSVARRRSVRRRARPEAGARVCAGGGAVHARAHRLRLLRLRFGGRRLRSTSLVASSSAPADVERCMRLQRSSGLPTGSRRSCWRGRSGAVTITARGCVSASRRTSTALRRAISSSRTGSRRSPTRASASVSLASAARAVRAASSGSSGERRRRLGGCPTFCVSGQSVSEVDF
jgi:hypothetical protein